jgi:hypothetical protein
LCAGVWGNIGSFSHGDHGPTFFHKQLLEGNLPPYEAQPASNLQAAGSKHNAWNYWLNVFGDLCIQTFHQTT